MSTTSPLKQARAAYDTGDWSTARSMFAEADQAESLTAGDLERWGLAAFLVGRDDESDSARERAHYAFLGEGEPDGAARVGHSLGVTLRIRGEVARAGGWFGRVQSVLEQHRMNDSVWHHYLRVSSGMGLLFSGQAEAAVDHFTRLLAEAEPVADPELQMLIRNGLAQSLVATGRVPEGLRRLDEVMVRVTTDSGISPQFVGLMYCAVIDTCRACFDLQRAREWTAELSRWCARQPGLVPYRGQCLVHRSEVLQMHGSWADACTDVERVLTLLDRHPRDAAAGMAHYQRGELHRLRGEQAMAEASFRRASQCGRDPLPGLSLLRLAQGEVAAAWATIRRAVGEASRAEHDRVRLLPAYVEIAVAADDVAAAEEAAVELRAAAGRQGSTYLSALAYFADGQVRLQRGAADALVPLREALILWQSVGAIYDSARCRVSLALACRAVGDEESAQLELDAARLAFHELGASPDLDRVDRLAGGAGGIRQSGLLTVRESQVLRLVATGATNRAIAADLFLSEKTVARHVANIFLKLGVSSRAAATAYAFEHRLV
ncbi:MAG TPA: LuxR C-terminal-related transcriptional regulator [Acidimicrobiales bacterium]|nr:LuxR C-terminal-related transcriptional regulator [Acidimicrobiales bacterium]